ncbi:hypothetical protein DEU56DRAFT_795265 [Suillus clintonianus]|uniref:uncharacterized protein n=1 Tax=Suillus clintonianus TaxID=1904413 RepID=UPI001B86DEB3|nr:uncharacterized protein DEU56DRAFT_795265 [Suillus clintonianus]KAG2141870.1 hypothetical protein DEU56DRAFT_795265 [Suillus clintonianus]
MLVVHPESYCDVCLDIYSISSGIAHSPHVIACGHIFCLKCLRSLSTTACPLCREPFQLDRVKKLYLENPPKQDNAEQHTINARHARLLRQCVSLVSGEDAPKADAIKVVTEALELLQSQPDASNYHVPLQIAVASFQRCKVLQDESEREKAECRRLRDHGESLLSRIQTIENEYALSSAK